MWIRRVSDRHVSYAHRLPVKRPEIGATHLDLIALPNDGSELPPLRHIYTDSVSQACLNRRLFKCSPLP
jgi:hypothetical protein